MFEWWKVGVVVGPELAAVIAAVAAAVATVVTATRKRQDTNLGELQKRVVSLEGRVNSLEGELGLERRARVDAERKNHLYRLTLAKNGIADPTLEAT